MNRPVALWLFALSGLISAMVVFGGWVRLTRSGLSMVEWHVVADALPPVSQPAWEAAFAQYQQTPEYQQLNAGMSLGEYQAIYYREWGHRLLGRVTGLAFVLPLAFFLWRGMIPWRSLPTYGGIGLLFAAQALVGRSMVASGLVDQPQVSPYWLTFHLLCALVLLGACLWLGFESMQTSNDGLLQGQVSPAIRRLSIALLVAVVLQIALGGLVAGMKAGHLSAAFPKMFGQWIPDGLGALEPWFSNLAENPVTVHFQHRWFGFVVLGIALALQIQRRRALLPARLCASADAVLYLLLFQILIGVAVLLLHVATWAALLHQALALGIFAAALLHCHQLFRKGDPHVR